MRVLDSGGLRDLRQKDYLGTAISFLKALSLQVNETSVLDDIQG